MAKKSIIEEAQAPAAENAPKEFKSRAGTYVVKDGHSIVYTNKDGLRARATETNYVELVHEDAISLLRHGAVSSKAKYEQQKALEEAEKADMLRRSEESTAMMLDSFEG